MILESDYSETFIISTRSNGPAFSASAVNVGTNRFISTVRSVSKSITDHYYVIVVRKATTVTYHSKTLHSQALQWESYHPLLPEVDVVLSALLAPPRRVELPLP
jgi:hypothetical protein